MICMINNMHVFRLIFESETINYDIYVYSVYLNPWDEVVHGRYVNPCIGYHNKHIGFECFILSIIHI